MSHYSSVEWIWQNNDWPEFYWQEETVLPRLRDVRFSLGILLGKASSTQKDKENASALNTLLENIITSLRYRGGAP